MLGAGSELVAGQVAELDEGWGGEDLARGLRRAGRAAYWPSPRASMPDSIFSCVFSMAWRSAMLENCMWWKLVGCSSG